MDKAKPEGPDQLAEALARTPRGSGRRLRGAVAHYLGSAIVSGQIAPGAKLTGEIANSEALNVSRSAYREAVQVLTAKGLVASKPKDGTRVMPRSNWNLLDPLVLTWAFTGEPDPGFVRDLFELRALVEPGIARLAAERRSKEDLAAMKAALAAMRQHTLATEAGRTADREFHEALLRAAGNEVLMSLAASIGSAVNLTTQYKQRARALPRDPIPDHARVYDAVAAGDGDGAAAAMQALVDLAHRDTREVMDQTPG
ncbi:FadR family transcriptional regulator [Altererythrobacter sp. KTW20L]|uniref:FadR/GntR family transcriptional regulator n=1 Tax=Altererythrobacter sp. KTW20L TaxID=2942210 RepID=UPI0020BEA843|nr:FadR/GntR family transcriptional regulator [Altererythrobacter sp. KTW20L]MCL6251515.1 FadR family transcriptional regulator [Altererythrobacter sp. KTW20L]